ncbi:MAG: NAD-dependent epimerase/dehydratase family protein [Acidobacteria bacterium]|nr:MAG: NAD-dependent epimerase/dehydratase family protein [Acidobacteriota bacterium]
MIAIVGASGNTGSVVAERLLAAGEKIRAIGRAVSRLEGLARRGAEVFTADVTEAAQLTKAFEEASAVYAMVPPNISVPDVPSYQGKVSEALAAALAGVSIKKAVVLSSIGADKPEKTGPVTGLHRLEERLNNVAGLDAVYLRAGYFMENILPQIGVIRNFGMMAGPVRADLPLPMIATRDIGAAAAELLLKPDFTGKLPRELLGQRDVTYAEIASIVGKALGKPGLNYIQLPPAQLRPALAQMGMSDSMANLLLEMSDALNSGYMVPLEPRSTRNTTPTSIETFVTEEFVPRFQAA